MQNRIASRLLLLWFGLMLLTGSAWAGESHVQMQSESILKAEVVVKAEPVVEAESSQHFSDVLEEFNEEKELAAERAISDKSKHQVLFWMGGALLLLIFCAAGFGVAMGIFDKDVFVWHVLSAGLATTLALAHAVTAFVWFYPS